jgi:3-hydroxyisobutyrate dehydrogenase-like beta-hydroxyacid dehydrogenase
MARGGFIGVGNLGNLMARNLIKAGYNRPRAVNDVPVG